ncbi:DBF4-type zinc finger-containing protein 2 [Amphiprion ocellaris]|uniref:DBF4-type zinc finger-containing protein 2 n=1 Tax=Amphiprion ocellaris TaxID=80972 RepID=UPI002410B6C1|nr:DBF4-type zinc finger-containing protein 2 [Amphiprion ocellaris]XP_054864261.1 DBF4-type zinc finger-containing protein 2 [Amphiprion ocellaris]
MSDSSDEDEPRKAENSSRMWAESQPGPSRCQPSRQGYCGYCRVLYSNLDQHLSSLKHLDSVRSSSRGSSTVSSASSRSKLTLLERFLQDVMQHHPHRYNDPRPSHADLPSVSAPPLPRAELDELRFSDDDSRSRGTREHLPSSDDASCQGANQQPDDGILSQSGERADKERLSAPITEQEEGGKRLPQAPPPCSQTPPPQCQAPPSVHRKAHRKTNRRKTSDSSASSQPRRGPGPNQDPRLQIPSDQRVQTPSDQRVQTPSDSRLQTPSDQRLQTPSDQRVQTPSDQRVQTPSDSRLQTSSDPMLQTPLDPRLQTSSDSRLQTPLDPRLQTPSDRRLQTPSDPRLQTPLDRRLQTPSDRTLQTPLDPRLQAPSDPRIQTPSDPRLWLSWQKQRREAQKEETFSSDHSDLLDQTIEEVIQVFCHGISSTPCQQEETESFHLSLPVSMETHSDDWDSPVQVVFQRGHTPGDAPVQVAHTEGQDLSRLMDVQVDLEDQVYSYQLDSALHSDSRPRGGARRDPGFWGLPIEEVLPAPERIPESFRGKSWAQIEQEDEEKVDRLVRQFRRGRFLCYFDSESLARYGRRDRKGRVQSKETEQDSGVLPLLEQDSESVYVRRRRRGRRRSCRLASRCQVVKVSHSTQTVRLVVPAVHQLTAEAPPSNIPAANQDAAERTPEVQAWHCLPPSYYNIITPVQPRTSLVYLLCSPSGPAPACTPAPGSAPKRCRKRRRPLDQQRLKVKYKQLPVRFYEPGTNRILKNPPKGLTWRRGSAPTGPPPPCVRQLFRSLSPDLNTDRPAGEGSSKVKGHSNGGGFLLSTLSRDSPQTDMVRRRGRTSPAPSPSLDSRFERGRGGRKTRPPTSKRRTRAQATPPQPRREGLRRAGPAPLSSIPPSSRRGRGRRGRR